MRPAQKERNLLKATQPRYEKILDRNFWIPPRAHSSMWPLSRPVKEASSPGLFLASLPALKATKAITREINTSPLRSILYRTKSVFTYMVEGHPGFPLCKPMGCWKMKTPDHMSQSPMGRILAKDTGQDSTRAICCKARKHWCPVFSLSHGMAPWGLFPWTSASPSLIHLFLYETHQVTSPSDLLPLCRAVLLHLVLNIPLCNFK